MPRLIVQGPAQVGRQGFVSGSTLGGGVGVATKQLGREISTLGRVLQASSEQAARRKAAEFGIALQDAAVDINLDPNIENREKRFQETQQSLRDKFRPNAFLGSPAYFDTNADISSGRLGVMVKSRAMQDAISSAKADGLFVYDELVLAASRTEGADDQVVRMLESELQIEEMVDQGIMLRAEADKHLRRGRTTVAAGVFERKMNDNPAEAERFAREDIDVDEASRQRMIRQATKQQEADLRGEAALENSSRVAEERVRKQTERAWAIQNIQLASGEGTVLTQLDVDAGAEFASPALFEKMTRIANENGGRIESTDEPDMGLWPDLYRKSRAGIDVEDEVIQAVADGTMDRAVGEKLLETLADHRFEAGRELLEAGLKAFTNGGQGLQAIKVQRAINEYEKFAARSINDSSITSVESEEFANELVRRADIVGLSANQALRPILELLPEETVFDNSGGLMLEESEAALVEKLENGMPREEFDKKAALLREHHRILESQKQRGSGR